MDKISVFIVDDHEVVRMGLLMLLSRHQEVKVIGEAGSGGEAMEKIKDLLPDVVVMDIRLPDRSGIEVCRDIKELEPNIKVIMLTSYSDDEVLFDSIMAGASGYVLKEIRSQSLVEAITTVGRGGSLLDPVTTSRVLEKVRILTGKVATEEDSLNDKERVVLALIAEGKTNKQIAAELFLGEKTVRNYVSNIFAKLSLTNRTQAAVYADRQRSRKST
ncbi:MAG: response regulator transcription factor [Peptococcaceae bacterium]|jgi:DNA-binding NarL/FixJ family response regulator|nr:response regulator transcription factor [Peptococcaceae bacterium]